MVINITNKDTTHVKFISYTGRYPNLCSGVLTLEIDGVEHKFGHDFLEFGSLKTDGNYNSFWSSGGCCGFTAGYADSYIEKGEWQIDATYLPEEFREYTSEIDAAFNDNVPYGCCGGCL